jgi:hypothetical protein
MLSQTLTTVARADALRCTRAKQGDQILGADADKEIQ